MPKYKITVSKNQKKYTIVYEAQTEKQAKDRVHEEGYSILGVEEYDGGNIAGKEYIFEIIKNGKAKKGKVIGTDLFKVYLKLRDGLGYNISKLYIKSDEALSDEEKAKILKNLEEQYNIFKNLKKDTKKTKKDSTKIKKEQKDDHFLDNFYIKKELEETYKLIDTILEKLKNIIEKDIIKGIDIERKNKLKNIYNAIVKVRNSNNIAKLKQIGEKALLKIGEIELEKLETQKTKEHILLLKQTNRTLKQIGSDKQFVEKSKDINFIINNIKLKFNNFFNSFKKTKKTTKLTKDRSSYSYLKTLSLINKYKKKLRENNLEILKNLAIFIFPVGDKIDKKYEILIKRSVIKQNIALLKAKAEGKVFSYTKTIKGYKKILKNIFGLFLVLRVYIFYTIVSYSFIFILLLSLNYYKIVPDLSNSLNFEGIFYFLVFLFTYFAITFSRGLLSLIFNFVILSFIIIFGVVNF